MTHKNCLILGGGGFIGSHLAEELLKKGYKVRIFDVKNFSTKNISHIIDSVEIMEGNFNNTVDITSALKGIDFVYHLISATIPAVSMDNPIFDIESNLLGSVNLIKQVLLKKIKRFVFISSGGTVYGIPDYIPISESHPTVPISSYGIIKNTIEHYILLYNRLYNLDAKIFRLSNPYGIRQNPHNKQGVIPVFLYKIITGQEIEIWGDGEVIRDYIHISDCIEVLIKSIEMDTPNLIFNLGSGEGTNLNQLLNKMKTITNLEIKTKYLKNRNFDVPINILDISRIKKEYSWMPKVNMDTGINKLYDYLKLEIKNNILQ